MEPHFLRLAALLAAALWLALVVARWGHLTSVATTLGLSPAAALILLLAAVAPAPGRDAGRRRSWWHRILSS